MEQIRVGVVAVQESLPEVVRVAVGLDTGNGVTNLVGDNPLVAPPQPDPETGEVAVGPEHVVEIDFPSARTVYGPSAAEILARRGGGPEDWGRFGVGEHVVRFDGGADVVVGSLALQLADQRHAISSGLGDDERYVGLGVELGQVALAAAYPYARRIEVELCTGLPVRLWTPERAERVQRAWQQPDASGRPTVRRFTYLGRPVEVLARSVAVKAEGHAAWATLDADRKAERGLITDIGARTAIGTLMDGSYVEGTHQADMGVERVLDQLNGQLRLGRDLTPHERHELKFAVAGAERYEVRVDGKRRDILPLARQLFRVAGEQLARVLASQFDLGRLDYLALSGGGAVLLHDGIRVELATRELGHLLLVLDQPGRRTAWGYYRQLTARGQRKAPAGARRGRK